ncbi:MAG: nitroreductase family protein [Faecalibacterium sp.]
MQVSEAIKGRRSIRKFKDTIVDRKVLTAIMEDARFSPSWRNGQIARFTFVQDDAIIKQLSQEGVYGFAYNAGTLQKAKNIAILSVVQGTSGKLDTPGYATSKENAWEMFDAGIACQTFLLSAYNHGIATCVMGVIDDEKIAKIINLPKNETVAAMIAFGYADDTGNPVSRKEISEICRFTD